MADHTTFKIGGCADIFVTPESEEALLSAVDICRTQREPYMVIGHGSNLLISDRGIAGVVICTEKLSHLEVEDTALYAQAGAMLSKAANFAADHALAGMEFASGIPGTVGGGVFMNAGAYGGELKDIIESVRVLRSGKVEEVSAAACGFGYRTSIFQKNGDSILGVAFRLHCGNREEIREKSQEFNRRRKEKQPLEFPSAGSTFKRPEGYFAGKLIQDAGLSGKAVGGAMVSEKHNGFVINTGGATAQDVVDLIAEIKKTVAEQSGVQLQEEIRITGRG